ncbi:MAG: hypothetical protein KDE32_09265 [Novosphingobium sp.]|nr:hypothetical protein [Novosphingobium sp.]
MREYDVPLEAVQVNWGPEVGSVLPPVEVVGFNIDDDLRYQNTWGSCNIEFAEADSTQKLQMLLAQFAYITAFDEVPPREAFKAFRQIPEFRELMRKVGWSDDQ